MSRPVKLFYDVLSPYSWIAFEVLHRYKHKWNLQLQLCPFYLAGIMQSSVCKHNHELPYTKEWCSEEHTPYKWIDSTGRPPGMVQMKGTYMLKDLSRLARFYQIPINAPSDPAEVMFVKGSLKAQRLLTAANIEVPDKVENLSRELWMRVWSRDEDITEVTSLTQVCVKGGLDEQMIKKILARSEEQDIKDKLKASTQEAFELGAFGAPFIVAYKNQQPEVFFGSDRFELMAHILGVKWEGPLANMSKM